MKPYHLNKTILAVFAGLVLMAGCAAMPGPQTSGTADDTSWMFHDIVDASFVASHLAVPMPENVVLIDSRPYRGKYVKGHIPGAISIPFTEFDEKTGLLPEDKNVLLIFYCEGPTCRLSHKSARKAQDLGYTNIKVYSEGFPEWISLKGNYASVSAEYVAGQIAGNRAMIIDSRPQIPKYNKGYIPSAINIPFTKFEDFKGKLPRDTATPVIFYCGGHECRLSHKSAQKAIELGYTDVSVFSGGYPEWKDMYGETSGAIAVKAGEVEGAVDIEWFTRTLDENPESISLIDVRDADEFAKGAMETAINIPVEVLEPEIKNFSSDKPIVYVCSTGARSAEAYYMTKDVSQSLTDVFYVEAKVEFNKDGSFKIKKND